MDEKRKKTLITTLKLIIILLVFAYLLLTLAYFRYPDFTVLSVLMLYVSIRACFAIKKLRKATSDIKMDIKSFFTVKAKNAKDKRNDIFLLIFILIFLTVFFSILAGSITALAANILTMFTDLFMYLYQKNTKMFLWLIDDLLLIVMPFIMLIQLIIYKYYRLKEELKKNKTESVSAL